jgi:cyclophilin family peptidyl-prolyl cis-trans isomerase
MALVLATAATATLAMERPARGLQAVSEDPYVGAAAAPPPTALVWCETTQGAVELEIAPSWAPAGAARFLELVAAGFLDGAALFRCIDGFVCQFGLAADPTHNAGWAAIPDDPRKMLGTLRAGMLAFAGSGPASRTTQLFVALADSDSLGTRPWETPIGAVVHRSRATVAKWYTGYGDHPPGGSAPPQAELRSRGSAWAREAYPRLDFITTCVRTGNGTGTGLAGLEAAMRASGAARPLLQPARPLLAFVALLPLLLPT